MNSAEPTDVFGLTAALTRLSDEDETTFDPEDAVAVLTALRFDKERRVGLWRMLESGLPFARWHGRVSIEVSRIVHEVGALPAMAFWINYRGGVPVSIDRITIHQRMVKIGRAHFIGRMQRSAPWKLPAPSVFPLRGAG